MAATGSGMPSPLPLEVPAAGGQIAAIGATEREGVFVAFIVGGGIQYLQLSEKSKWVKAALSTETVAGAHGLHVHGADDEDAKLVNVSFVDGSQKAWVCLSIPSSANIGELAEAKEVGRVSMPSEVVAACSSKGRPAGAVALGNGAVRFVDLSSGQVAGKGLKLEPQQSKGAAALVPLGPYRVALIRGAASAEQGLEFFVVALDQESQKTVLHLRGTLSGEPLGRPGPFSGAAAAGLPGTLGEDRVILCWQASEQKAAAGAAAAGCGFASAVLAQETPKLMPLPSVQGLAAWTCANGYIAQWSRAAGGGGGEAPQLTVRDARFGMTAASGAAPLPAADKGAPLLTAAAGGVMLVVGRTGSSTQAAGARWSLPSFSLQMIVGRGAAQQPEATKSLGALQEVVSGKRQRDDPAVEELFRGKRHASTDKALAAAVRKRSWAPSLELVNEIVYRRSWAAACALLSLPELDEDLSIKLLSARLELLARVVRRARAPHLLEHALRDNLPASQLPKVLEVLLQWLDAYRDFPEDTLRKEAPGLPEVNEIVTFLGALADGCLPMLAQLEVDLLERTLEALLIVQKRSARITHLYATLREAYRIRKPLRVVGEPPAIEVMLVEDF